MTINLIHPPHYDCTDDRLDPPLGLLHLARALKIYSKADVYISDLSGVRDNQEIDIKYANIYGITVYCATLDTTRYIIDECKEINPDSKIVVGGAHVTGLDMDIPDVDHYVKGYGEMPLAAIANKHKVNDIILGDKIIDLQTPLDWSMVDVNSYSRVIAGRKSLPLLTSRGCPYKCAFCGLNSMHKICNKVRFLDIDNIKMEIRAIKSAGINALNIQDDIFTLKLDRMKQICEYIKELGMVFRCMGRAGNDTEETYKVLADSGCQGVAWGIESGSQMILDRMNKEVTVEQNKEVISWCKKYGMDSRGFFILGFPGETRETIEETKQFIIDADPDQYFVSNFIPYPGTDVYENPYKYGITQMSYDFSQYYQVDKDGYGGAVIDTKWMNKEEFSANECGLREWLKENKEMSGKNIQRYEEDK